MSAATDSTSPAKRRARTRQSATTPPRAAVRGNQPHGRRWLWLIPTLTFGLLALMAVISFDTNDTGAWGAGRATHNWTGPIGHGLAWMLFHAVGISAYGVVLATITIGVLACSATGLRLAPLATLGWFLIGSTASAFAHLLANPANWSYPPGGAFGRVVGETVKGGFSLAGGLVLLGALLLIAILLATHFAAARAFEYAARGVGTVSRKAARHAYAALERRRQERADREEEDKSFLAGDDGRVPVLLDEEEEEAPAPPPATAVKRPSLKALPPHVSDPVVAVKVPAPPPAPAPVAPPRVVLPDVPSDEMVTEPGDPRPSAQRKPRAKKEKPVDVAPPAPVALAPPQEESFDEPLAHPGEEAPLPLAPVAADVRRSPAIVEPRAPPKPLAPSQRPVEFQMTEGTTGFHTPQMEDILEGETHTTRKIDRVALTETAEKLRRKLLDMGVEGDVTEIRPGPVVTMYEFKPAAGIKLSRIAALSDDLAMAMEALRVRIVAPIPGKGVVGFEVPNRTRETVFLKEVVEQEVFQKSASKLTMAVGKDIEGLPYVADLAKMPHLLIAGTTGSGKSVGVNAMLTSMLMRATPEELRFIMVDPKMLELSIYEGIPHLLLPVVVDPKKAALALRWAVEEMERRYSLLAEAGVRNLAQYNKHIEDEYGPEAVSSTAKIALPEVDEEGNAGGPPEAIAEPKKKLPYVVIVIDELADLMMVAAKEVEVYIARLAQMARASGIHLMVATQRPSTDVLTGVIKANFPTRISFQVASRHDSATIINTPGAENLLGMGDMLIQPPGTSSLTRVHGAYVSEVEINRLTTFWKEQGSPVYDAEILRPRAEDGSESGDDEIADELYDQALAAVSDMRQISISLLQRKMRIGYNRAARMIERMEREGIVGAADGAKPRDVLIRPVGEMPGA
jgi:S-DNA-T family DNA segregation ATPase FtsK/SpoIIIE